VDDVTADVGTLIETGRAPRAFLVVQLGTAEPSSQLVELVPGSDVTFGRSRSAVVSAQLENVSRLHARVWRTGETVEVEDLGSRNGTWVNGARIAGPRTLVAGDEIAIGSIHAVFGVSSGLRRASRVLDATGGELRLAAEVDRAVRYRRALSCALLHIADDTQPEPVDAILEILRPMDDLAEYAGSDYLVLLPELGRAAGEEALAAIAAAVRRAGGGVHAALVVCPDEATSPDAALALLRSRLRGRSSPVTSRERPATGPIVIDPVMSRVYKLVEKIADAALTVLVLGETGVGKELIADAIHRGSRRTGPLVKLNCGAIPAALLESELFGHERGAFTGADRRKIGYFEAADRGTLFLDEIGEMPLELQTRLLRVLETKTITRVGDTVEIPTDVRIVAATHRDLHADVRAGRFRQDVLYRIAGFTIAVPPLRDRKSEILPLAEHFLRAAAAAQARPVPPLSDKARDALLAYRWPGNVRELENAIERAVVMCEELVLPADLPERVVETLQRGAGSGEIADQVAAVERAAIVAALEAHGDNQTRAARTLGLSRRALIYKMEKYGLKPPPGSRG
jgi:two-component system, NtrC family, response regulator AtoC